MCVTISAQCADIMLASGIWELAACPHGHIIVLDGRGVTGEDLCTGEIPL